MFPSWTPSLPHAPCFLVSTLQPGSEFDRKLDPFGSATSDQYLYPGSHTPLGLSCGIFREEPAIARLDWFFATNLRSGEHFDCSILSSLHPTFGWTSLCPRLDRLASGLWIVTARLVDGVPHCLRTCCFRFGFGSKFLNLATTQNSPLRYSKLTRQHRLICLPCVRTDLFHAAADFGYQISGSFHPPFQGSFQSSTNLLILYRSRVVFRLGG